jgi:hypothetical protein
MLTVPPFVWRAGALGRALTVGAGIGAFLGALAWLDSGIALSGAVVFVIIGSAYGIWMGRRMIRYWPAAAQLTGSQREQVVRATRSGRRVDEPALAAAVIEYRDGLHAAAEKTHRFGWLVGLVLMIALASAVWDALTGSVRDVVSSGVYLGLLAIELFWWPRQRDRLLRNADRAAASAMRSIDHNEKGSSA